MQAKIENVFRLDELQSIYNAFRQTSVEKISAFSDRINHEQPNVVHHTVYIGRATDLTPVQKDELILLIFSLYEAASRRFDMMTVKLYMEAFDETYENNTGFLKLLAIAEKAPLHEAEVSGYIEDYAGNYRQPEAYKFVIDRIIFSELFSKLTGKELSKWFSLVKSVLDTLDKLVHGEYNDSTHNALT